MTAFRQLLRKDWRVNRAPVVALVVMMVMAYVMGMLIYLWDSHHYVSQSFRYDRPPAFAQYMFGSSAFCLLFTVFIAAAFGGNAFASERRERWADFLAMASVSRHQIALSKLLVGVVFLTGVIAFNSVILYASVATDSRELLDRSDGPLLVVWNSMALSVATLGLAWFFSTFLESATIAAALSLAICIILGLILAFFIVSPNDSEFNILMRGLSLSLGIGGLAAGEIYYACRVAP